MRIYRHRWKRGDFFTVSRFRQDRPGSDKRADLAFPLLFALSPVRYDAIRKTVRVLSVAVKFKVPRAIGTIRTGIVDDPLAAFVLGLRNPHLAFDHCRLQGILDHDVQRYPRIVLVPIRQGHAIASLSLYPFDVELQRRLRLCSRDDAC